MSLMAWIDYSSIIFFFVVAGLLIVVIGRPRRQSEAIVTSQHTVHEEKTTYIALAVLCLLLACLAWAANKRSRWAQ